jgi:hypothetical protein
VALRAKRSLFFAVDFFFIRVCARLSFGKDHAIVGSIPQRIGIPHSSDPTGRWNRLGPDQKISDGRNLDWRTKDRPHSIPISAYLDPRPWRNNAGDHGGDYVFDTWLYAGTALVLAWALPRDPDHVEVLDECYGRLRQLSETGKAGKCHRRHLRFLAAGWFS